MGKKIGKHFEKGVEDNQDTKWDEFLDMEAEDTDEGGYGVH